jgi:hypothetical protein
MDPGELFVQSTQEGFK